MRQKIILIFTIFILALQACQAPVQPRPTPTAQILNTGRPPTETPFTSNTPTATADALTPSTAAAALPSTTVPASGAVVTQTLAPAPTEIPTLAPTQVPTDTYSVWLHPDGPLYVGDLVSMEVIAPAKTNMANKQARAQVDAARGGPVLGPANFGGFGSANRTEATLLWAWDTHNTQPGSHTLTFSILPGGPTFTETVTLQPQSELPPPEPGAHWASVKSKCCLINYITGTAAERDITQIMQTADAQAQDVEQKFGSNFTQPITITLVPRVLGQGGFAGDEISVSYSNRNYIGNNFDLVIHQEMVHIMDARSGGDLRPTMLVEGLAVYMTGGHFKKEPIVPRAAALLDAPPFSPGAQGWYIPLTELGNNFYNSQHDIGYLEGAALIAYMVQTWSWKSFNSFYRDIHPDPSGSQVKAMDTALKKHFGIGYDQLEQNFLTFLRKQTVNQQTIDDLRLTVTYYDTMRRYQLMMDPSAYFQTAWLLDNKTMRQRGIVADYLRRPEDPQHVAIETMLLNADEDLVAKKYVQSGELINVINQVLNEIELKNPQPFNANPTAADYLSIVETVQTGGRLAQHITINGDTAQVAVTNGAPQLSQIQLSRQAGKWTITK